MKKLISYILLSVLLIAATSPFIVLAAETDWSAELTTNENNINITLSASQTETQVITSLHFRVNVSITSGKMDAPTFQFAEAVESKVKDAVAIIDNSSNYIIDIVLSGTKDQNIFKTGKQANIGTILLHPTTSAYKVTVEFTGITSDSKEPAAEYITRDGQFAEEVTLVNTKPVNVEKTTTQNSGDSSNDSSNDSSSGSSNDSSGDSSSGSSGSSFGGISGGGVGSVSGTSSPSTTPNNTNTQAPVTSAAPVATIAPVITTAPTTTETPSASQEPASFDSQQNPKLQSSVKKGSNIVKLTWSKVDDANGYIIYTKTKKKYKNIKTISNPEKTACSLKMNYATSYSFRICAFKNLEDGSNMYGKYSSVIKVTTAPAKVKGLKVKRAGKAKTSIYWKKVAKASGYQIFKSRKKNGGYTLIKTLKKGSILHTNVKQKGKKTYYYKIRAYVNDTNQKRVYGNFGKSLAAKY